MDKNTLNFLMFGKKELTGKEVGTDILLAVLFWGLACIICSQRMMILGVGIVYLIVLLCMGTAANSRQKDSEVYFYRGVVYTGYSIACFVASYGGVAINRSVGGSVILLYSLVYLLCCVVTFLMIRRLIKKDAYNTKKQPVSTGGAFLGSALSVLLCPIIFSGSSRNQTGVAIALIFLFLGAILMLGMGNLYKAVLFIKYEKEFDS